MAYWVYVHTNNINGKIYVGTTQKERPEHRWGKNGEGYHGHHPHFWNAIQKYGWDNFSHEAWEVDSAEEMWAEEQRLIALYDSTNFDKGYNRSSGGEASVRGVKKTPEQCALRSVISSTVWSDSDLRKRQSKNISNLWQDPCYREHMSDSFRDVWNRPGYRDKQRTIHKEAWKNQDLVNRHREVHTMYHVGVDIHTDPKEHGYRMRHRLYINGDLVITFRKLHRNFPKEAWDDWTYTRTFYSSDGVLHSEDEFI